MRSQSGDERGIHDATGGGIPLPSEVDPASDAPGRRYLVVLLAVFAASLAGVAALNVAVDPSDSFGTDLFEPLVWTARSRKVELLAEQQEPVTGLILGSSRAMKVEPAHAELLWGGRWFNGSVNSAMTEDLLAMYRYATDDLGHPVDRLVLGLDGEAFHDSKGVDERLASTPQLARQVPGLRDLGWATDLAASAISYQQTMLSLRSIRYRLTDYPAPSTTFGDQGLLTYVVWERELAAGTFDFDAALKRARRLYRKRYEGFEGLSPERTAHLTTLLDLCAERGVDVRVYLTPLHPELRAHLARRTTFTPRMREVSAWLEQELAARGVPFLDGTDPTSFGGDPDGFFDGAHPLEANNRLLLDALAAEGR